MTDYRPLHLDWPGLANARDLGGLPVDDGRIKSGALIRTESLTRLTDPEVLREAGVSLIVDLRRAGESPEPHPFADDEIYVNLPVEDPADAKEITSTMGMLYLEMLDARPALFAAALGAMADAGPGAVLVHCAAGKDRTGLVVALALRVAGADREVVAADYAVTGERLAPYAEAYLASIEDEEQREFWRGHQATPVEFMLDVLDHVDGEYGGAEAYLSKGGMTDEQLSALRERLVARPSG
ncbi:MAG: tyrosine-protein phosphatase [Nocardioides sp.]